MAGTLSTLIYSIFGISIIMVVLTTAFSFFGIGFATYGNYLFWAIALTIFYFILPERKNIFSIGTITTTTTTSK